MSEIKQVSLFVENRPGRTAKVAKTLSDAGVNIRALTIAEAGDFGVIRMVLDDAEKGYKVLKENAFTVSMTDVLAVEMPDHPGGMNAVLRPLKEAGINVITMYPYIGRASNPVMILEVDHLKKATEVLKRNWVKIWDKGVYKL